MKKISIAVVIFNEEKKLPAFLQSLLSEIINFSDAAEVLFIDNNSTDATREILKAWKKENSTLSIQIIERNSNHMGEARQQALQKSQGDFVVFLDADCFVLEGWMKSIKRIVDEWSDSLGGCGGPSVYEAQKQWHHFAKSLSLIFPWGSGGGEKKKVSHMPTCNYIIHREKALEVGGFSSIYERVGEDLDFNIRLRKKYEIMYNPQFSVSHQLPQSVFDWYRKMAFYGRAQSIALMLNRGGLAKEKFAPLALVFLFILSMLVFPVPTQMLVLFCLLVPRLRFFLLSFLFYGFGELVGFFIYALIFKSIKRTNFSES